MGYTNSRAPMKWSDLHTNTLKYFYLNNLMNITINLDKGWLPGYELMTGTNIYTLTALTKYLLDHHFIKYDIF